MKDNLNVPGDLAEISDVCGLVLMMLSLDIAVKPPVLLSQHF